MNVIRIFLCFAVLIASIVSADETRHLKTDTFLEADSAFSVWTPLNNYSYSYSDDLDDSLFSLYLLESVSIGGVAFFCFTPIATYSTDTAYVIRAPPIFSS